MMRVVLLAALISLPSLALAGERVTGTNTYPLNQEIFQLDTGAFWTQDNAGMFEITEGPIEAGYVRCLGSGTGGPAGIVGKGICIYGLGEDTFTMSWSTTVGGAPTVWHISGATGKYEGMSGSGTSRTRVDSKYRALVVRVTDWEGELNLPGN